MLSVLSVYIEDKYLTEVREWLNLEPEDLTKQRLNKTHYQLDKLFYRWCGGKDTLKLALVGLDKEINVYPYPSNLYLRNPVIMGIKRRLWSYYKIIGSSFKNVKIVAYLHDYEFTNNILKITIKFDIVPSATNGVIWDLYRKRSNVC